MKQTCLLCTLVLLLLLLSGLPQEASEKVDDAFDVPDVQTTPDVITDPHSISTNAFAGMPLYGLGDDTTQLSQSTRTSPYGSWEHDPPPAERARSEMVYDTVTDSIYMFGGITTFSSNDLWRFDIATATWHDLYPTSPPAGRMNFAMAFDTRMHEIYVWGGYADTAGYLNDLWKYNITNNAWSQVSQTSPPSAREYICMVYSAYYNALLLVGGMNGEIPQEYSGLYAMNMTTHTWGLLSALDGGPRYDYGLTLDDENHELFIYGGCNSTSGYVDTLMTVDLTGPSYSINNNVPNPGKLAGVAMIYHTDLVGTRYLYLFGGYNNTLSSNLWRMDIDGGGLWTLITNYTTGGGPNPRTLVANCLKPSAERFYVFGGYSFQTNNNEMWYYSFLSSTWVKAVMDPVHPNNRMGTGLEYSKALKKIYLFGGNANIITNDTWAYDPVSGAWSELLPTVAPTRRQEHMMAYDPVSGGIYMFGGWTWDPTAKFLNDLWYFDESSDAWIKKTPLGTPPTNRSRGGAVVDPATGDLYVYGGSDDTSYYSDLWKYNPFQNQWSEVSDINPPNTGREGFGMALDPSGGGFFVFGGGYFDPGQGQFIINNELWRFDFTTKQWTLKAPSGSPPAFFEGAMCSGGGNLYALGGMTIGVWNLQNDLHIYNVTRNQWQTVAKQGDIPPPRVMPSLAYDPVGRDVYLFGGWGSDGGLWKYGLLYDLGIGLNFTEGPVCYAAHHAYDLAVNVSDQLGVSMLDKVRLTIAPTGLNISVLYNPALDSFTEENDTNGFIDISQSIATNDGKQAWTLHFKIVFDWDFPTDLPQSVKVWMRDLNGFERQYTATNLFSVQTGLKFSGALVVTSQYHGIIKSKAPLVSGEKLNWGGIAVVYKDTTNIYPPNDQFDIVLRDDDATTWTDATSSGRNININSTVDTTSDPSDIHYTNLTGLAAVRNPLSLSFELQVDAEGVTFTGYGPSTTAWLKQNPIRPFAIVTDMGGGLVNASSVKYSLYDKGANATVWTSAGMIDNTTSVNASVTLTLKEGESVIRWQATDQAGNALVLSTARDLRMDSKPPEMSKFYPADGTTLDATYVNATVFIQDNTSGIDTNTVEYQLSKDGGGTYSDWTKVSCKAGKSATATVALALSLDDENLLRWRCADLAGNYVKNIKTIFINVSLPQEASGIPDVTLLTPANGSKADSLGPTMTWNMGAYTGDEDLTFNLYLGTNPKPLVDAPYATGIKNKRFSVTTALSPTTKYYWTVLAKVNVTLGKCISGVFAFDTPASPSGMHKVVLGLQDSVELEQGSSVRLNLTVENQGDVSETVTLSVASDGGHEDILSIDPDVIVVLPGKKQTVQVTVTAAKDTTIQIYEFTVVGTYSGKTATSDLAVSVIEPAVVTDDDDDTGGGLSGIVVAMIIILLLLLIVIAVVIIVVMRRRKRPAQAAPASPGAKKTDAKPSAKPEAKPTQKPDAKPKEAPAQPAPRPKVQMTPIKPAPKPAQASPSGIRPEEMMAMPPDMEALFAQEEADGDVAEPEAQIGQLDGWDIPELGANALAALPPAVMLDAEDSGDRPYHIEEILIMNNTGMLLTHFSRGSAVKVDKDILAGMLTTIQNFVKDSFNTGGQGISDLSLGDYKIYISPGKEMTFIAMVSGTKSESVRKQLDKAREKAETELGEQISQWSGDMAELDELEDIIRDLLAGQYK